MNPRKTAVGIQQVLVRRAAADESHAAGGRRAEAKAALKIRVRLILDRPGSIDHDQMGEPVRHALDDGCVLIGIVTPALREVGDGVALRGILLHKSLAFRRIRLDSGDHFRAAGFIEIKAVVVDADVVQIAESFPRGVYVFSFIVGFAAELAVCAVLKEDVVTGDHRIDHRKYDEHDNKDREERAQKAAPDVAFFHRGTVPYNNRIGTGRRRAGALCRTMQERAEKQGNSALPIQLVSAVRICLCEIIHP